MNILFLCSSNIFRSQIAEAFFNKYSKNNKAESAALIKPQERMHKLVIKAMKEKGIDITTNKSKIINKEMIDKADLVILMNPYLKKFLNTGKKIEIWSIPDVIASEEEKEKYEEFISIRDIIENKVKELINKIG